MPVMYFGDYPRLYRNNSGKGGLSYNNNKNLSPKCNKSTFMCNWLIIIVLKPIIFFIK